MALDEAPNAETGAVNTPTVRTRSANRIDHQKILNDFYNGDQAFYHNVLQQDAEDASANLKPFLVHVETRCNSYKNAKRVSDTWVNQLEQDQAKMDSLLSVFVKAVNACVSFDLAFKKGANVDAFKLKMTTARDGVTRCNKMITETLAACESVLAEYYAESAGAGQTRNRRRRRVSDDESDDEETRDTPASNFKAMCKPDKLQHNDTPSKFEEWVDQVKGYCHASELLRANILTQQQVILRCVDSDLRTYLMRLMGKTTPLFGINVRSVEDARAEPGSIVAYLNDKFKCSHPLSARRLHLFRLVQQSGQTWSSYYEQWMKAFKAADMSAELVSDVVPVTLLMAGTLDEKLIDEFQRLKNPTCQMLYDTAVEFEANRRVRKVMRVNDSAKVNRTESERKKPYRGGNADNYIKQHFKKLEAEGRCCKCAEKIGSQGEEAHKKSCKANGAKCKYCSSKGFGSRAKGHLEAACAKKLHAQVRNIDADGADDESASTRSPQSSSEEEYDDGAEIHRITVEDSSSDDDSSEEEYESDDEETNWVDDWMANSDEEADDNDWAPLPGYYSYSSDDEECPEDKTEQEDHDDDSLRLQQAQVLKLSQQQGEAFSSLVSRFDNSWDQAKMGKLSTEELQGLMHEARRPSKSVRRRRRRRAAVARVKQAAANRQVPLVYVLEDISNVPKNVPVPMFDINFRQHERRGPWHSVAAIADTGANRSIFSLDVLKRAKIGIHSSRREKIKLASQQASMTSNGHVFLRVKTTGDSKKDYVVINALVSSSLKEDALISYDDLRRLRVIDDEFPLRSQHPRNSCINNNIEASVNYSHVDKLNEIADRYPDVFDAKNLKPLKVPPMEINVNRDDPDYKPLRVYTARKTPLHFEKNADELLKYLLDTGVIKRADPNRTYEWVSPAFFVPKRNGSARLVVDFSRLSQFADRTPHPFPSPRDVIRSIKPDSRWFITSDMKNGYYQLRLSEAAMGFTAFLLPQGLFVMCRGPQGLSSTSDVFVAATDHILEGLDLIKIIDDCLIQGVTPEDCLKTFEQLCERARKFGLTLTRDKLRLAQEVSFAGWVIGKDGIKSDPYKLAAIAEFPTPRNLRDLRSFCGAITQLNLLSPDIAHAMHGLRPLLKARNHFEWTDYHDKEFRKVRSLVSQEMTVKPFDMSLPTRIYVDASRLHGMGYALCQVETDTVKDEDGNDKSVERLRVVQCNSRALQPAETRYATNELECGALVWSILDSRHFVFGLKNFAVFTDHRPLEAIFRQPLADVVNARMLRMREKVSDYSFTVEWKSGSKMALADALSRNPVFTPPEEGDDTDDCAVINMISADPALQAMYDAAEQDKDYQSLLEAVRKGTPLKNLPENHHAKLYPSVYDNLSIHQSLLVLDDSRIVVPKSMRDFVIQQVHSAHSGIARCLQKARAEYFWLSMKNDITNAVLTCEQCQKHRASQPEEDVIKYPPTTEPMQLVGSDLFSFGGHQHVILADAYSGMIFVKRLKRETASAVIKALANIFRITGLPQHILTDNGPCYDAEEFSDFCLKHNIVPLKSSPGHPRSNGLSESHVNSAKTLLMKSDSFEEFENKMLDLITMPRSGDYQSPAEKFYGRKIRTLLPVLSDFYDPAEGKDKVTPAFAVGDRVRLQDIRTQLWDKRGTIVGIRMMGRSFEVSADDGGTYVRNRRFIKPLTEPKTGDTDDDPSQSATTPEDAKSSPDNSHVDGAPQDGRQELRTRGAAQRDLPAPRRSKRIAARRGGRNGQH